MRAVTVARWVLLATLAASLAACDQDKKLPGQRIPVRPDETPAASPERAQPVAVPAAAANADWAQRNGALPSRLVNPALRPVPALAWTADLGLGDAKRRRLLAAPIVAGGVVYGMDAGGQLSACSRSGQPVWSRSLVPAGQEADAGPGGGMAAANGVLYVTTGFGEVFALDPRTGGTIWQRTLEAPIRNAPTAYGGQVLVVLRDDTSYALDARSGGTLWRVQGSGGAGLLGGASPATDGQVAVLPFASGEVLGVLARNGLTVWGTAVIGGRREFARNRINDISGAPVIDGSTVYASNQSGRTVRIDMETGERLWTILEGSYGPAWAVGNAVYLLSDIGSLVRVDGASGTIVWEVPLPQYFPNPGLFGRGKPFRAVEYYGPVLAGGRLWVAGSDGLLRGFSPVDGSALAQVPLPAGAAAPPAVAGGILYVPTQDGRLLAFQ
jgi:outer membrane protein assembly factor BamB